MTGSNASGKTGPEKNEEPLQNYNCERRFHYQRGRVTWPDVL